MIEAIREVGEHSLRKDHINSEDSEGLIEIFCEDIQGRSPKPPHILTIDLERKDNQFLFIRVTEEEYSTEKNSRYLYRFGSSRGSNVTPTSKVTDIGKTYPNKIKSWFEQDFTKSPYSLAEKDLQYIKSLKDCLEANESVIIGQIETFLVDIRLKKESALITLMVKENNQRQYLGDIELFRSIFIKKTRVSLYQKYTTESIASNQICSVCRKKKEEVYGFVSTFNFYTVDKPGMVSGGFDQSKAWKNYPVCLGCALALERGKKYLDNFSTFRFYGFDYYVIPKPLLESNTEVYDILKIFHSEGDRIKMNENYHSLMSDTKDEIFHLLSEKENSFLCNILIYQENNNEFKIERYIEDIFPSRLKELFNAKNIIDAKSTLQFQVPLFKDKKKVGDRPFEFTFESIVHFFGKEIDHDARTYFLDIVSRIFTGKQLSYPFVLSGITRKIRKSFAQNSFTKESTLRGLALLAYLNELKLLGDHKDGITMTDQTKSIVVDASSDTKKKADAIFLEFPTFFDSPAKRAVFLEGILCQKLLNIQYSERKATPFRIKLQGLKLDQRRVQGLLPEIQNKLEEYKKNYYRDLERLISTSMVEAGNDWRLSKDEIAFYFILGMNLVDQFVFEKQDDGGIINE
ncbi:MAG: TIGR02556 family CRISPR-associated protein [Methanomicrobiales archaeon]|nr:TIGR02556 family CRISPR-associated protein [Methanomicrobiales archaeon]